MLMITTMSLGVLHWAMQKNFSQYVADVEMQKLNHLINNLADVYAVYDDWGNAIQAQILQIEGDAAPDDYDRLSHWWLRRQYDIALQQRYFEEHSGLRVQNLTKANDGSVLDEVELELIRRNLPSEYQPFEGLKFPLSSNKNLFRTEKKMASPQQRN